MQEKHQNLIICRIAIDKASVVNHNVCGYQCSSPEPWTVALFVCLSLPFLAPGVYCTNRKEYPSPFHLFKINHGRNEYIDEHDPEYKWCLPQQSWFKQREENARIHGCFCGGGDEEERICGWFQQMFEEGVEIEYTPCLNPYRCRDRLFQQASSAWVLVRSSRWVVPSESVW